MKKLSVIVPVYNVEKYLRDCLNSICKLDESLVQIICVEDQSTDHSYSILKEYEKEYSNIEVYQNIKNGGLAYSRNQGLRNARGKYIMFVDSDDVLEFSNIETFLQCSDDNSLDVLLFDVLEFNDGDIEGVFSEKRRRKKRYGVLRGISLMKELIDYSDMYGSVWDGVYRRQFLSDNGIMFIDGILHEDIPFTFESLIKAERASCLNEVGYHYRQREGSILHKRNYEDRLKGLLIGYAKMTLLLQSCQNYYDAFAENDFILKYFSSIFSMIENNYRKIEDEREDVFLNQFLKEFRIDQNRKMRELILCKMKDIDSNVNGIYVYGAGEIAETVLSILQEEDIYVNAVLVTSKENNKDSILGFPVYPFEQVRFSGEDSIILAMREEYQNEVAHKLKCEGYCGKMIFLS